MLGVGTKTLSTRRVRFNFLRVYVMIHQLLGNLVIGRVNQLKMPNFEVVSFSISRHMTSQIFYLDDRMTGRLVAI